MISVHVSRTLLPKRDSRPSECEDAIGSNLSLLRFAVSDGATEGFDSRRWAHYLAAAWACVPQLDLDLSLLHSHVEALGQRLSRKHHGVSLPWYLEEKASQGAFAAFVGLHIQPSGTWEAIAVGDCCLVHLNEHYFYSFPLSAPDEFSSRPVLIPSLIDKYKPCDEAVRLSRGTTQPGDRFLLMSDAIASWYLGTRIANLDLLRDFTNAIDSADKSALVDLVRRERADHHLRNDDVAILSVRVLSV